MNLPNKLTLLRILLIPVFVALVEIDFAGHYLWAVAVFAIASFTDYLDGHLARKWGLVTDFGKFADPLADKILTTTAIIYLVQMGLCHPVVLIIIIAREFAVSGVRMIAAGAPGGKVIAANMWGKVKTVLQMVSIIVVFVLLGLGVPATALVAHILMWAVGAATLISGVQYLWGNRQYINTAK
ncbi:MAG TPA: CDP-diacylglycerol--glycerol-3-phosphate 3-phosphatidyltransferase [Candidatus Anaerofilum excrementigallinarum]|nr:CDP-diacylglycerol--glycerol-3-phosphate 3-phosphatidyltransferase [Candidatus Anaerofilum excrementigallinarum]